MAHDGSGLEARRGIGRRNLALALAISIGLVAAVRMGRTGAAWIDPALSIGIAILVFPRALHLLRQSAHVLLEGAPREIDQAEVLALVGSVPGVTSVHDLHLWTLTSGVNYASLHVAIEPDTNSAEILRIIEDRLRRARHIEHATVQIEQREHPACSVPAHR